MRHQYGKKRLGRNTDERKRLIRGLIQSFLRHGELTTTRTRGQVVRSQMDKLVTLAKRKTDAGNRRLLEIIDDRQLVKQFVKSTVPALSDRVSGYTKRLVLADRRGDGSTMVKIQWLRADMPITPVSTAALPATVKAKTEEVIEPKKRGRKPKETAEKTTKKRAVKKE